MSDTVTIEIAVHPKLMVVGIGVEHELRVMAIQIAGPRGAGKTTLAEVFRRAFTNLGAEVTVKDGNLRNTPYAYKDDLPFEGAKISITVADDEEATT